VDSASLSNSHTPIQPHLQSLSFERLPLSFLPISRCFRDPPLPHHTASVPGWLAKHATASRQVELLDDRAYEGVSAVPSAEAIHDQETVQTARRYSPAWWKCRTWNCRTENTVLTEITDFTLRYNEVCSFWFCYFLRHKHSNALYVSYYLCTVEKNVTYYLF